MPHYWEQQAASEHGIQNTPFEMRCPVFSRLQSVPQEEGRGRGVGGGAGGAGEGGRELAVAEGGRRAVTVRSRRTEARS